VESPFVVMMHNLFLVTGFQTCNAQIEAFLVTGFQTCNAQIEVPISTLVESPFVEMKHNLWDTFPRMIFEKYHFKKEYIQNTRDIHKHVLSHFC